MHPGRLLIALGVLAVAGRAQPSASVSGPVTGFVFDAQLGAVRPMLGIPGAAYLGAVAAPGLVAASVAPDGSAALAVRRGGALLLYTGLRGRAPAVLALPGSMAGADFFAWSPDNTGAAIFSSGSGQGQMLTGLPRSPVASSAIDLSSLAGRVTALAFDGQRLIVGVSSAESGGIYIAGASSGIERIAPAASPSAIVLAGAALYFADSQSQQIFQVRNYAGAAAALVFASDSSISSPAGLQVSADGQRLYVANAGSRKLAVYDIPSQSPGQTLDLNFTPTRLDRFGDPAVFLMNGTGQGPLYVARDGGPGKAAVYFVPSPAKPHPPKAPVRPL